MTLHRITSHRTIAPSATHRHRTRTVAALLTGSFLLCTTAAHAQAPAKPLIQGDNAAARMEQDRLHMAADQRQQKMLQDADKLLQMAQQLKVSVDKTDKNTLSVDVVKEAERIEKLARQVKDNMRQ